MRVEAFVIHLARAEQRRPQVETLRRALPMPAHVIEAVDGREMTRDEIASVYRPRLHRPHYPFPLGAGEIGCFLSHRKAWREIVARRLDAGLIVEDDITVDGEAFGRVLELVKEVAGPADYIRFPHKAGGEAGRVVVQANDGSSMLEPRTPGFGTIMQLVGHDAASRLLEFTETVDRPVDTFLQMRWAHGLRVLSARPIVTSEISRDLGGTMAQGHRRGIVDTISREIRRPLYRGVVRLRNKMVGFS